MLTEDRLAIEALHRAWLDAELRGDTSSLLRFSTAAPVWLPPNEAPLCGRDAILRWLGGQPPAQILQIDIDQLAISGMGPLAWKLASFRTRIKGPGGTGVGVVTGCHAWLLQRDDAGAWRIGAVAWTIDREASGTIAAGTVNGVTAEASSHRDIRDAAHEERQ